MSIETYLAVKARGLKLRLLPREFYHTMLETPTLEESIKLLSRTEYRLTVERGVPSPDEIRCATLRTFINRVEELLIGINGAVADFVRSYSLGRVEMELLKELIRVLSAGHKYELFPCPNLSSLRVSLRLLSTLSSLEDVVQELGRLYDYKILVTAYNLYRDIGEEALLECGLEADYYDHCWNAANKVHATRRLKELLLIDSSSRWIYWLVLLKTRGIRAKILNQLLRHMVKGLDEDLFRWGIKSPLEELHVVIGFISRALEKAYRSSFPRGFLALERELGKVLYSYASHLLRLRPIDLSYTLACLLLHYFEANNVYRVLVGKIAEIPPEIIRQTLYL